MIEMKSDAQVLNGTPADVYNRLTHPGNLQSVLTQAVEKARQTGKEVPSELDENIKKISFGDDYISFQGGPTGELTFRLGDCTQDADVKYVGDGTPVAIIIDFNLQPEGMDKCLMSIMVQADIPFFLRPMVQGPLRKGLDTFASLMQQIPSWR